MWDMPRSFVFGRVFPVNEHPFDIFIAAILNQQGSVAKKLCVKTAYRAPGSVMAYEEVQSADLSIATLDTRKHIPWTQLNHAIVRSFTDRLCHSW